MNGGTPADLNQILASLQTKARIAREQADTLDERAKDVEQAVNDAVARIIAAGLAANDPRVSTLTQQLVGAQQSIDNLLQQEKNLANMLQQISIVISSLAALVGH